MNTGSPRPAILIVDDAFANVKLLSSIMRSLDAELIEALSGEEALEAIEALAKQGREVAVALVDIMMPGMSGVELATILKTRTEKIPVIFVTARDTTEIDLELYYEAGAVDFILKPFNKNIIVAKVQVFLELFIQKQNIENQRRNLKEMVEELRISNNAQKESENMYRAILNASPSGILIMDHKGLITEISAIVFEIFHSEKLTDFVGKLIFDVFPSSEKQQIKLLMRKAMKEGIVQNVEFVLPGSQNDQVIAEVTFTLIQDPTGVQKGLMCIVRDVSQRKMIEQQLIRSERLISLGEMASAMAHEINQPLLSMSLGLDNMLRKLKKIDTVDQKYFIEKSENIFKDINRIDRIIEHVRAFSRDNRTSGHILFSVNDSIRNSLTMVLEQFSHQLIELVINLDESLPEITGDTYKFEQVMLNLLINSKDALIEKALLEKDFKKQIIISSFKKDNRVFVKVVDNGNGIDEKIINRIMLPFFTTKDAGQGTGLGLSISYAIIKELNGSIEVKSSSPDNSNDGTTGTEFIISLPVPVMKK